MSQPLASRYDFPPQISDAYAPQQMRRAARACECAHACAEAAKMDALMDQGSQILPLFPIKGAKSNPHAQSGGTLMWDRFSYCSVFKRMSEVFIFFNCISILN